VKVLEEKLESTIRLIRLVHQKAEELAREWFPDVEKYPQQKRIAVLSLMRMIIEVMREHLDRNIET